MYEQFLGGLGCGSSSVLHAIQTSMDSPHPRPEAILFNPNRTTMCVTRFEFSASDDDNWEASKISHWFPTRCQRELMVPRITGGLGEHGSTCTGSFPSTVAGSLVPTLSFIFPALHMSYSLPSSSFYFVFKPHLPWAILPSPPWSCFCYHEHSSMALLVEFSWLTCLHSFILCDVEKHSTSKLLVKYMTERSHVLPSHLSPPSPPLTVSWRRLPRADTWLSPKTFCSRSRDSHLQSQHSGDGGRRCHHCARRLAWASRWIPGHPRLVWGPALNNQIQKTKQTMPHTLLSPSPNDTLKSSSFHKLPCWHVSAIF